MSTQSLQVAGLGLVMDALSNRPMLFDGVRLLTAAEKALLERTLAGKLPTLAIAKKFAQERGWSLRKREGEYRIGKRGDTEKRAYYTTDLSDALETARLEGW